MTEQLARRADDITLFAEYRSARASLKPAECDDGGRCWVREGPPAAGTNNCIGCGGKIKVRLRSNAKLLTFDGQEYPGRKALACHLVTLTGRSLNACIALLQRHGDDGARVLERCRASPSPPLRSNAKSLTFGGQSKVIRAVTRSRAIWRSLLGDP